MALCCSRLHKILLNNICRSNYDLCNRKVVVKGCRKGRRYCSSIAIEGPNSLTSVTGIRWGLAELQGAREEMEDEAVIIQSDGFTYAAVFDGHAGFSSVKFLREELYRECMASLQGGQLLNENDFSVVKKALEEAFVNADRKLLHWHELKGEEDDSGSTVTAIFVRNDVMFISHVGDSSVILSRSGKSYVLTDSHRPYGKTKVSMQEIKRIRDLGGWISNGRICGDISVSRSFGDIRFKSKKNEMLKKGIAEGRWSEKFASRIQFKGDLVTAFPDVYEVGVGPDCEFVILASDGLWDYMSSSDAVNFVRDELSKHGDVKMACEAVARMALDRGSQDNVSIVIADFGRTEWENVSVEQGKAVYDVSQALAVISLVSLGIGGIWWASTLLLL